MHERFQVLPAAVPFSSGRILGCFFEWILSWWAIDGRFAAAISFSCKESTCSAKGWAVEPLDRRSRRHRERRREALMPGRVDVVISEGAEVLGRCPGARATHALALR